MDNTKIYLVYKTDVHHSYKSRDLIAVCSGPLTTMTACSMKAEQEGEMLSGRDLELLQNIKQTQGYAGDGEFQYEIVNADTLL